MRSPLVVGPVLALVALAACDPEPLPPQPPPAPAPPPASAAAPAAPAPAGPPAAPVHEVRDDYFGLTVVDPYRWMESDSPEMAQWMKAQADYTRGALDALPSSAALHARVKALDNAAARVRSPSRRGKAIFYLAAPPGTNSYKLFTREGFGGAERLLVDPDALAAGDKHFSIDYVRPSPDGRLVAYGLSQSGSEQSVLHVVETATGRVLPDSIDRARYASVSWQGDKAFFYKRDRDLPPDAPAAERMAKSRVLLHELGKDPAADAPVFGWGVAPDVTLPDDAFPSVYAEGKTSYLLALVEHGVQPEVTIYAAPRRAYAGAKTPWKKIVDTPDEVVDWAVHDDDLYLLTHHGAPRFKLVRTSLKKPDLASAVTVIPESEAVLSWIGAAADGVYVRTLEAGFGRLRRVPFGKGAPEPVDLPAGTSARTDSVDVGEPGALVEVVSWTAAPQILSYDPKTRKVADTGLAPRSPVVFTDIVADEVTAKSEDGTMVPLSIVHRRDLPRDGNNPTWLLGYGAYGFAAEPAFEPMHLAWLEQGGVVAACHPRGGGEFGEAWHTAGKLATKPNTIKDFIACAQRLVDDKFTSPAHLAGDGRSAGGILIGGAITARPDLFGAAVIHVGMNNALRFEQIPIGPFNTSEFGTVKTPEGFQMLLAIDAFHHVKDQTPYPAVLVTTGITDPRVSPWQSAKMAARLQAATSSGKPVLLRVDYEAGHGMGSSRSQSEDELADVFAFLLWQVGKR
jgi:prolyl oligopeptidase